MFKKLKKKRSDWLFDRAFKRHVLNKMNTPPHVVSRADFDYYTMSNDNLNAIAFPILSKIITDEEVGLILMPPVKHTFNTTTICSTCGKRMWTSHKTNPPKQGERQRCDGTILTFER